MDARVAFVGLRPQRDALQELLESGYDKTFDRGQSVFEQGDPTSFVYHIVYGCVGICAMDPQGHETFTNLLLPGDIYVDRAKLHQRRAWAFLPTGVGVLSYREFEHSLAARSSAAWEYMQNVELQFERALELATIADRPRVVSRLAALFLWMHEHLPESEKQVRNVYSVFPFVENATRAMIFCSREHVSISMNQLRDVGAIEYGWRGMRRRILDKELLSRIADNGI